MIDLENCREYALAAFRRQNIVVPYDLDPRPECRWKERRDGLDCVVCIIGNLHLKLGQEPKSFGEK